MPQLLLEGLRGAVPFLVDRSKEFVVENKNGRTFTRIPGRFSICDSVNGNNRRYPRKVWEKNLAEGSVLRQAIARNAAFGLLEHPANGQISLQSPICIAVTDAKLQSGTDKDGKSVVEVVGEIAILDTAEGQKLQALIEFGYNPLVSSRGFGSVTRTQDGVDEVMEDYICEGWDVVLKPSFETAELWPGAAKESQNEAKAAPTETKAGAPTETKAGAQTETMKHPEAQAVLEAVFNPGIPIEDYETFMRYSAGTRWAARSDRRYFDNLIAQGYRLSVDPNTKEMSVRAPTGELKIYDRNGQDVTDVPRTLKAASPSKPVAAATAASESQMTEKAMTINEIKSRIGAVAGMKVPSDPTRFAEGLNEMAQLHQEIANFVAEDAARSWQGQQLHEQLKAVEQTWNEAAQSPAKQAKQLSESYRKVLRVTKALGEAAVGVKKKLAEALSQNAEATQLVEELTTRGQQWVAYAESLKRQLREAREDVDVTCEALDILADRYNTDMTASGKRLIELEFAETAKSPEVAKKLSEARHPSDIIAIRESITAAKAPGAPNKAPAATGESRKQVSEAKANENEARVLVPSARTLSESVEMVKRLSASAK